MASRPRRPTQRRAHERKSAEPPNPPERPAPKRSHFTIPWYLTPEQTKLIEDTFPDVDVHPLSTGPHHHHACLATERYIAENAIQYTLYKLSESRSGDLSYPKLVDVGGNPRRHSHYRRHYIHTCSPIIDAMDPIRHYTVCKAATATCTCVAPNCQHITGTADAKILPADATFSVHVYTLSALEILQLLLSTKTGTHFAAVHNFDDLQSVRGAFYKGEAFWTFNARTNDLVMKVSGGSGYRHPAPVWMYRDQYYEYTDGKGQTNAMVWSVWRRIGYTTVYAFTLSAPRPAPAPNPPLPFGSAVVDPNDWGTFDMSSAYSKALPKHVQLRLRKARIARVTSFGPVSVVTSVDQVEYICPKALVSDLAFFVLGSPRDDAGFQATLQRAKMLLKDVQLDPTERVHCALYSTHLAFTATLEAENNMMAATIEDNRFELQRHKHTVRMQDNAYTPTLLFGHALTAFVVLAFTAVALPLLWLLARLVHAYLYAMLAIQLQALCVDLTMLQAAAILWAAAPVFRRYCQVAGPRIDPLWHDGHTELALWAWATATTIALRAILSYTGDYWHTASPLYTIAIAPVAEEILRRSWLPWYAFPFLEFRGSLPSLALHAGAHYALGRLPLSTAICAHAAWNAVMVAAHGSEALSAPIILALLACVATAVAGFLASWLYRVESKRRRWQRRRHRALPDFPRDSWLTYHGHSPTVAGVMPPLPDITSRRPLAQMRQGNYYQLPDEIFTDTKGAVTHFYGLASATLTPRVHATNTTNEEIGICNRALMVPPGIAPRYGTLLLGFTEHFFDDLFYGWRDHYPILPFIEAVWVDMQKDKLTLRDQAKRLKAQPDAQNAWFKRSTFTKRELLLTDTIDGREEKDPRNITAALPAWRLQVGPWFAAFQAFLKLIWNLHFFIVFVCGHSADAMGRWAKVMADIGRAFWDDDVRRFDASLVMVHLELELFVFKKLGADLHRPYGISVYELQNCMTNTVGRGRMGTIYKQIGTRHSGDAITSSGNSIHTGIGPVFDWFLATRITPGELRLRHELSYVAQQPSKPGDFAIACCGDDQMKAVGELKTYHAPPDVGENFSTMMTDLAVDVKEQGLGLSLQGMHIPMPGAMPPFTHGPTQEKFPTAAYALARGFNAKPHFRPNVFAVEFCSSRPYPVRGGQIVWGPKIGRALPKFLATCDLPANIDRDSFVIGVLASTRRSFQHVPVLRVVHEELSRRYKNIKAAKPYTPGNFEWQFSAAAEHKLDEAVGAEQFYRLYGLHMNYVESHVRDIFANTPLGHVYRSELIQRIEEVDAPVEI